MEIEALPREVETVALARAPTVSYASPASRPADDARYAGLVVAGRYRLERLLGRGGMGEVWVARHLVLGTRVAVKFLMATRRGPWARAARERFRFEAQIAAQLGPRSPHIVAARDAGEDDAGPWLVLDYVPGQTLREALARHGPLSLEAAADVVDQVAAALSVAHAAGVIHRDLKPGNLLTAPDPRGGIHVELCDFGIAKALHLEVDPPSDLELDSPDATAEGFLIGSPAYMSPESAAGLPADAQVDRWALAVIAYESLSGKLPFAGRSLSEIAARRRGGRFPPASEVRKGLPHDLDRWFSRALAPRPGRRFASSEELARTFRRAALGPIRRRSLPRLASPPDALSHDEGASAPELG